MGSRIFALAAVCWSSTFILLFFFCGVLYLNYYFLAVGCRGWQPIVCGYLHWMLFSTDDKQMVSIIYQNSLPSVAPPRLGSDMMAPVTWIMVLPEHSCNYEWVLLWQLTNALYYSMKFLTYHNSLLRYALGILQFFFLLHCYSAGQYRWGGESLTSCN